MSKPDPYLYSLLELVANLSKVERNHFVVGTDRHENDVEHSYAVAMLCWYICSRHKLALDMEKVLKYALVHDVAEVYAGDVSAFADQKQRIKKQFNEAKALKRLSREFEGFPDLVKTMQEYEAKQDEEARFVWSVDKTQALIYGQIDDWRPYKTPHVSYDEFCKWSDKTLENSSIYMKEIFSDLVSYAIPRYFDQPKQ